MLFRPISIYIYLYVCVEVIAPIIRLLFDYPNHNVLHSEIERLVVVIIRGNTDFELRQHLLDVLVPQIYQGKNQVVLVKGWPRLKNNTL